MKLAQQNALLSILDNGYFLSRVAGSTKMARKYYNEYKYWCSNINLNCVQDQHKTIRLVLHKNVGCYPNSNVVTSNLNNILKYGPNNDEEAVFYFYYKHHDFFIDFLSSLKQAFQSYTERKVYCKNIKLPGDFDWPGLTTHADRNFIISGEDIIRLYGSTHFIDRGPLSKTLVSQRKSIKLPKPIHITATKSCVAPDVNIPVGNYLFRNAHGIV